MDDLIPLAARLRRLRQDRGLTLAAVARMARIGEATLGRWESGTHRPNDAALARLLDALGVRGHERVAFADLVGGARWSPVLLRPDLGPPVAVGQVARALRLRQGATQADLARSLGVTQATVARWEGGDRTPGPAFLDAICAVTDASAEEREALRLARGVADAGEEDLVDAVDRIRATSRILHEAQMLAQVAERWRRAVRHPEEEEVFASAMAQLAHMYYMEGRAAEATEWALRALRIGDDPGVRVATTPAFYVLKEQQRVGAGAHARLAALTREWLEGLPSSMSRVWMLQNLSWSLGRAGEAREAHTVLARSLDLADRLDLGHAFNEPKSYAALHLVLREPERILETLQGVEGADELRLLGLLGVGEPPPEGLVERVRNGILTEGRYEANRRLRRLDRALAGQPVS